jgi:hypothetical protein
MHLKLGHQLAQALGVSPRAARRIALTDPLFPPVAELGPRTRVVDEAAVRQYLEARRMRGDSIHVDVQVGTINGSVKA